MVMARVWVRARFIGSDCGARVRLGLDIGLWVVVNVRKGKLGL